MLRVEQRLLRIEVAGVIRHERIEPWNVVPVSVALFAAREMRQHERIALDLSQDDRRPRFFRSKSILPYLATVAVENEPGLTFGGVRPQFRRGVIVRIVHGHVVVAIVEEVHDFASVRAFAAGKHLFPQPSHEVELLLESKIGDVSAAELRIRLPVVEEPQRALDLGQLLRRGDMDVGKDAKAQPHLS